MSIVSESSDSVKCEEFTEVIEINEGKVRQHVPIPVDHATLPSGLGEELAERFHQTQALV